MSVELKLEPDQETEPEPEPVEYAHIRSMYEQSLFNITLPKMNEQERKEHNKEFIERLD